MHILFNIISFFPICELAVFSGGGVSARVGLAMRHAGRSGFRAPAQPSSAPPDNLRHQTMDDASQHVLGSQSMRGTLSGLNTWSRESFSPTGFYASPQTARDCSMSPSARNANQHYRFIDLRSQKGASMQPVTMCVCVWVCMHVRLSLQRVALPIRLINVANGLLITTIIVSNGFLIGLSD